jgi:tetratricopeptide (TPR) repeat protein
VLLFALKESPLYVLSWTAIALNTLALLVAMPLSTAVHEAAHALVGRAVGLGIIDVSVGYGPVVWSGWIGSTSVEIRRIPLTGAVWIAAPSLRWLRARLMVASAAGPLSNAALVAASVWLLFLTGSAWLTSRGMPHWTDPSCCPVPALAFAVVNAFLFVKNALPIPRQKDPLEESSDGWKVLEAPFRDQSSLAPLVSTYAAWKVPLLLLQGERIRAGLLLADAENVHPGTRALRWARGQYWLSMAAWSTAAEELRGMLDAQHPDPTPGIANDLAWADVMQDDPALLEEADRLSALAFDRREPGDRLVHRTRGAVLLARGRLEEAQELLTFAFENDPKRYKAVTACLLAMVHARKGERGEAQRWLEEARECNPKCHLLPRAEGALARGEAVVREAEASGLADALRRRDP